MRPGDAGIDKGGSAWGGEGGWLVPHYPVVSVASGAVNPERNNEITTVDSNIDCYIKHSTAVDKTGSKNPIPRSRQGPLTVSRRRLQLFEQQDNSPDRNLKRGPRARNFGGNTDVCHT